MEDRVGQRLGNYGLTRFLLGDAVVWSPDGKHIASASGDPGTPSTGGDIQVWDINGKRTVTYTGHSVEVTDIAWSPDGTDIVIVSKLGPIPKLVNSV